MHIAVKIVELKEIHVLALALKVFTAYFSGNAASVAGRVY